MPQIIHIANTDVEYEYAESTLKAVDCRWKKYPLCLQLQFLPLLYAEPNDLVAVTDFPPSEYLDMIKQTVWKIDAEVQLNNMHASNFINNGCCLSWGLSRQVQAWAKLHGCEYDIPTDWDMVCLINSKAFSHRYSRIHNTALLYEEKDLISWLRNTSGPKVLKSCFGLSGQGNRLIQASTPDSALLSFCHCEWQKNQPIIAEPWLNRIWDFSSQWKIHRDKSVEWLGATRFSTDYQGTYLGTLAGPIELLFQHQIKFLEQHRQLAEQVLHEIAHKGFFGHIGIDAFVYHCQDSGSMKLYPLVEINGRRTMSLIALQLQQRYHPTKIVQLEFNSTSMQPSLLPNYIIDKGGKIIKFRRKLTVQVYTSLDLLRN